jgi:hypothetical protein
MSFRLDTRHFDGGHVTSRDGDPGETHRQHLIEIEKHAVGSATAWLVFYAIAIGAVAVTNFNKVTDLVVAALN